MPVANIGVGNNYNLQRKHRIGTELVLVTKTTGTKLDMPMYRTWHVPKWSRGTEHILFGTEMVCTEMDRYRTRPNPCVSLSSMSFCFCSTDWPINESMNQSNVTWCLIQWKYNYNTELICGQTGKPTTNHSHAQNPFSQGPLTMTSKVLQPRSFQHFHINDRI